MQNVHPVYRPEIDGLRALAILAVVAFHAFPESLHGGFIGVDIFFVISGYLISNIVFRSLQRGDFRFSEFYVRRVLRIFPALALVLLASYAYGWLVLLPDEFKQLGKQMAGGAGFAQNFVLSAEAGYFDTASELKPLMHLWSLSIEEQFYLFFPLLMWAAWRFGLGALALVTMLLVLSFGINIASVELYPTQAFFMLHTRCWELLAGSLLAYMQMRKAPAVARTERVNNLFAGGGLLLIVLAAVGLHKGNLYPGGWALFPVLGACLLIAAGPAAWLNRTIFASRLMVAIGLISYPLYLWHWPLLSFANIIEGATPSVPFRFALMVMGFLLAWLTYRMVERPLRTWSNPAGKTTALCLLVGLLGALGLNAYQRDGLAFRIPTTSEDAQLIQKISEAWRYKRYPEPKGYHRDAEYGYMTLGPGGDARVLFVGDSHAQQYWNTVSAVLERTPSTQVSVMFAEPDFPPQMDSRVVADRRIQVVVFSYFWAYKYGSDRVDQSMRCCGAGKGGRKGIFDLPLQSPAQMDGVDRTIRHTIETLKRAGKRVVIVLDNPFGDELDAHSKMSRSFLGDIRLSLPPALPLSVAIERSQPVRSRLLQIAANTGAEVIDPMQFLCSDKICPSLSNGGEWMYKDYDHLSFNAATHEVHYLDAIFVSPLK
ncbi:acyltransferase [Rhodoferax lacus]|uniref:Acyltransferase n=1 Tax=Rhodoferax lacus TaxID=2184758 RepID=A0A3E1R7U8_9BURK|nr:acyltransferase family protein [Rhodoferax lacus]RFO95434.1 acyltransferase [Rhodoferax lacus]